MDLLSPLPGWGGSQERGYGIGTWPLFGGLAAFEMRGYPGRLLYSEWKKFAFNSFNRAAQSGRKRGGLVVPTAKLEGRSWGLEFGGASLAGEKGPYGRLSIPLGGSQLGAAGLTRLTYGLQLTGMTIRDQNSFMIGFNLGLSTRTSRSSHSLGAGIDASILYDLAGSLGVVPELGGHLGLSLRDLELGTAGKLGTRDVTLGMFGRVGAPLGPKKINPYLVLGFRIGYEW